MHEVDIVVLDGVFKFLNRLFCVGYIDLRVIDGLLQIHVKGVLEFLVGDQPVAVFVEFPKNLLEIEIAQCWVDFFHQLRKFEKAESEG